MGDLLARLGVERPIVQAGMGGGISRSRLAAAVSEAGGLGTIGILNVPGLRRELAAARERLGSKPVSVNLLLPFAGRTHFEAASEADVLVTFWGRPERRTNKVWLHQCGSVEEARAAVDAGADGVIAQGVEAGGHVRGATPAAQLLEQVIGVVPAGYPVLSAGGIADAADAAARLDAGAEAVVCGTRFVMSEESDASEAYKQRLVDGRETILTDLFGFGWAAPHRVLPNRATERWLRADGRAPAWIRAINTATTPVFARAPSELILGVAGRFGALQRPGGPIFGPGAPLEGESPNLLESGALYAGETVARIDDIRPAGEIVRELAA